MGGVGPGDNLGDKESFLCKEPCPAPPGWVGECSPMISYPGFTSTKR